MSIFLLSLMVFIQTPVGQLSKIAILVEHFYEHKVLDEDLSLPEYIFIHYLSDKQQADHDRDMQLPFKHCSHTLLAFTFFELPAVGIHNPKPFFTADVRAVSLYRSPFYTSELLSNIWQPPRI